MATDDQRREVAVRLRTLADGESPMAECSVDALYTALGLPCSGTGIECAAIGFLADLIDRPTARINVNKHGRAYCPNCGCDDWSIADGSRYCPNCGVELIDD